MPLLTEQEENVVEVFELRVLPLIINILKNDSNVLLLQNAAQTLGNMAEGRPSYQEAIYEARGLHRIVKVLESWAASFGKSPSDTRNASWQGRQELLAKCCFAIWMIVNKNETNQNAFREAGGFPELVWILQPANDETLL